MEHKSQNITAVPHRVPEAARSRANGHRGGVLWLTGLPGSGKTTLAFELEHRLFEMGFHTYVLDGDNIRHRLSADLGFSPEDRKENIRRVGEVAALLARAGLIAVSAFISPYRADRRQARDAATDNFHVIYLSASLEVCEARDPKGLYKKARQGDVKNFTGVTAPYETPENPDLTIDTGVLTVEESLETLLAYVDRYFVLGKPSIQ